MVTFVPLSNHVAINFDEISCIKDFYILKFKYMGAREAFQITLVDLVRVHSQTECGEKVGVASPLQTHAMHF